MEMKKTHTRTLLATAAAGALVLGSAGAATAHPGKGKGPKEGGLTVTKVDIKQHKKIDLDAPYGDLKLRVKVRDTSKAMDAPDAATVSLAFFDSRRAKEANAALPTVTLDSMKSVTRGKKSNRKWVTYMFSMSKEDLAAWGASNALQGRSYLCISDVSVDGVTAMNRQTKRRLGDAKKVVRECVKVYDTVDPETAPA